MQLRIGTRGSKLSLVQTELVIRELRERMPTLELEKQIIHTSGDKDRETPLYSLGEKGIFEREIDDAVRAGRVDFAVHSLKDLPVFDSHSELALQAFLERGPPLDGLVTRSGKRLNEMPPGSTVGTSSLLRMSQLRRIRPDLSPMPIRGNVETRVGKVVRGAYDAAILAEAGLARLNMQEKMVERLSVEDFLPAPGQGIIAVVARNDNSSLNKILRSVDHAPTRQVAEAEREVVRILEGGCKVPIGALASLSNGRLSLTGYVLSVDGKERLESTEKGPVGSQFELAQKVAESLLLQGAKRLEENWRTIYA